MFNGIWLVTMHIQPENEVEAYKKSLRERGEKLEISEVLPPPIPAESNGVALMRSAFALFNSSPDGWTNWPPAMRMIAPGKAMTGWMQPDLRDDLFTNSWENAVTTAEASRPAMELLREATAYPAIDFQLEYLKGDEMLLTHLSSLRQSAHILSAAAMCDLHNGNIASAMTNLCTLLALIQRIHEERNVISQSVRIAMVQIAITANWELLQTPSATDSELASLQTSWERLDFIKSLENSFLMQRASTENTIAKMRSSRTEFDRIMKIYSGFGASSGSGGSSSPVSSGNWLDDFNNYAKDGVQKAKFATTASMWRNSWTYSDELNALRNYQDTLEALRLIETNQVFQPAYSNLMNQLYPGGYSRLYHSNGVAGFYDEIWHGLDDMNLREFFSGYAGYSLSSIRKAMTAEAAKRIVITAIALKRFQLKHGHFPERLSELTPEFLSSPIDPVDGSPLRYRRNGDGTFLLYSIGENGVDDGGDPNSMPAAGSYFNWQGNKVRDWVWPQPATAEEVQVYYEEQARKSKR
ncbi:MAG: hypothetical protein WDM80_00265 [Limisphaerales bacterium]